jgi:hypothetical protein
MGEMMRMVIAHEVGHALGFPHIWVLVVPMILKIIEMVSLHSGIAASLMDYARFNYIAQPGDKNVRFIRQMGPYDHYATNWGYRVIPNAISRGRGAYTRPVDYGKSGIYL